MTALLHHYLYKRLFYNLAPYLEYKNIELPVIRPFLAWMVADDGNPLTCTCCGWEGAELKARKHYLEVGSIAELELFCPDCNHYLGFLTESDIAS